MSHRTGFGLVAVVAVLAAALTPALASRSKPTTGRDQLRSESQMPGDYVPAVARRQSQVGRYFVVMRQPSVAQKVQAAGNLSASAQRSAADQALASQEGAISEARTFGGSVVFRYKTLVDGFSASLSPQAAAALAQRSDVASVQPVSIVTKASAQNSTSVPFIGAPRVWQRFGAKGQGIHVAVVDTGVDYTHKDFGGPGTQAAYDSNNPNFIEPGTFPTKKVVAGYDLVGSNYDPTDDDPTNDIPQPDADPLDRDSHGTHTSGTCCGNGVPGVIGKGVAPASKIYAIKVWDVGASTDDVLVAGFERAMDPNDDGSTKDAADVISFSGGVDYGTLNSVEARAAQRVVNMGTVFVAAAGNANNQPAGGTAYITGTPANARGVISVAASVDQYHASHLVVNSPSVTLPQGGLMFEQDWGADIPPAGITADLFDGRAVDPAGTSPSDAMFCDPLPANSLAGKFVVVYKGSTSSGDCAGSDKVGNAEAAGATGVILISIFPSDQPSSLGGDPRGIPAVMIGRQDGDAILSALSPDAPSTYNDQTVNVTLDPMKVLFPQFKDSMTDFSSEGPARVTNDLKPDISAPGFDITSAAVGTGTGSLTESGTSMATPHVSGVAALIRQLHPSWSVDRIKAVLMNQATPKLKNADLSTPVPATVMGAGRVRADESAKAVSVAEPGSLSYGLRFLTGARSRIQVFAVRNLDSRAHDYRVSSNINWADFDPALTTVRVSTNGNSFGTTRSFSLAPHHSRRVSVKLSLHPSVISESDQLNGWYYYNPNMDGAVVVRQSKHGRDRIRVPWHVAPLAASNDGLSKSSLDLSSGPDTMALNPGGVGVHHADLYLLGAADPVNSTGEEDIVATGARSFTGSDVQDGSAQGVPTGNDPLGDLTWQEFLTADNSPDEPVEIGVQTAAVHNTTETTEVDVLVDVGADGSFPVNPDGIPADFLIVKQPAPNQGTVCVYDLSLPNPLDECTATYFADYSNYNSNLFGLAVDARDIGLSNSEPTFSYTVLACTGTFSGDVTGQACDTTGGVNPDTSTYDSQINVSDPALTIDPLTCQGFWGGPACDSGNPISVDRGSAGPSEDPSIMALFPNNAPSRDPTIVTTSH